MIKRSEILSALLDLGLSPIECSRALHSKKEFIEAIKGIIEDYFKESQLRQGNVIRCQDTQ